MASPNKTTWVVRASPNLKSRLELIAKAEKRSLNNLIEYFLEYMATFYENAPIYDLESLLTCYHEASWSEAFGPEFDRELKALLSEDRKQQQKKLKEAHKFG